MNEKEVILRRFQFICTLALVEIRFASLHDAILISELVYLIQSMRLVQVGNG